MDHVLMRISNISKTVLASRKSRTHGWAIELADCEVVPWTIVQLSPKPQMSECRWAQCVWSSSGLLIIFVMTLLAKWCNVFMPWAVASFSLSKFFTKSIMIWHIRPMPGNDIWKWPVQLISVKRQPALKFNILQYIIHCLYFTSVPTSELNT